MFRPANSVYPLFFCPQHGGMPTSAMAPIRALPIMMEFDAKDEEQILHESQDNMTGVKMIVRPVREE